MKVEISNAEREATRGALVECDPDTEAALSGGPRALVVDDDAPLRGLITRLLREEEFDVVEAEDGRVALELFEAQRFDVVLSDVCMPGMSGLDLLRTIRRTNLEIPVILLTGLDPEEVIEEARKYGALECLSKPIDARKVVKAMLHAERLHRLAIAKRMAMDALDSAYARAGDRAGLERTLSTALLGLRMAFQPIVHAKNGALFGYEALMRSSEPTLPHPGAVLDAAERLGRVHDVGRVVRSLAARSIPDAPGGALIFVNLHSADLEDPDLYDLESPLTKHASRVVLEITERAALERCSGVEERIARLRTLGFRVAVDDLGAGYAGLTSFALLEPQVVKLDMSLVRDVATNSTKRTLVASLSAACRGLGVTVVAEGVETIAERDCLVELGCDLLQGYLFARPGPPFPRLSELPPAFVG